MTTHAIFIGINKYQDRNFRPLSCSENDANELASLFTHKLDLGEQVKKFVGQRVTKLDIVEHMTEIGNSIHSGDRFVFFFSGHGYEHPSRNDQYLLFPRANASLIKKGILDGELVPLSTLQALSDDWPDVERVFVIDACRTWLPPPTKDAIPEAKTFTNGEALAYLTSRRSTAAKDQIQSLLIINACQNGQVAYELETKARGVMAYALEACLKHHIAQHKPLWIDSELMDEVGERMQILLKENKLTAEQKPMLVPPTGKILLYKPKLNVAQEKIEVSPLTPISTTVSPHIELREQFEKHLSDGEDEGCEYILGLMKEQKDLKYIEYKRKYETLIEKQQQVLLEQQTWDEACSKNCPDSYRAYSAKFPQGKYLVEMNRNMQDFIIEGAMGHRYEVIGDGSMVKDLNTGLIWQRYSVGQSWNGSTCVGEAKVFTFDQAQKLARDGWRVPTVRELFSLVESSSGQIGAYETDIKDGGGFLKNCCLGEYNSPTINAQAFPNTPSLWFWSSSIYSGDSSYAWLVHFGSGGVGYYLRSLTYRVRLVR